MTAAHIACPACGREFEALTAEWHSPPQSPGRTRCPGRVTLALGLPIDQRLITQNQLRRLHFQAEAKRKRELSDAARWTIRAARLDPISIPVEVTLVEQPTTRRMFDTDGRAPSLKVVLDALVREGVLPEDDWRHVRKAGNETVPPRPGMGSVWVEIRAAEERQ